MKILSLEIEDVTLGETEKIVSGLKKTRNRYINDAIKFYNKAQRRLILENKFKNESDKVLKEYDNIVQEQFWAGYSDSDSIYDDYY